MNARALAEFAKTASFADLQPFLEVVADRLYDHRLRNNGWTPRVIFEPCIAIGGVYGCLEAAVKVIAADGTLVGYALKMRNDPNDAGWVGQYQIIGVALTIAGLEDAIMRLGKELHKDRTIGAQMVSHAEPLGEYVHHESLRRNSNASIVRLVTLPDTALTELAGSWRVVKPEEFNNPEIIEHHRMALAWVHDPNRPPLYCF